MLDVDVGTNKPSGFVCNWQISYSRIPRGAKGGDKFFLAMR